MVEFHYDIDRFSPGRMAIGPLVVLGICIIILAYNTLTIGLPVQPGIDFAGGTAVQFSSPQNEAQLRSMFSSYPLEEPVESTFIKFGPMSDEQYRSLTQLILGLDPDATIDNFNPTFGKDLQTQALYALLFSFLGMSIVVFAAFRTLVPAGAVVLSAFGDIVVTATVMHFVGITLSLGTTAALLMLIGYSVDSDILLTTRILKRKGDTREKFAGAFRTGLIMTTTTMAAVAAMWVVAVAGQIQIIAEIASVLFIGLVVDIFNTWLTNAGILKWYADRRGQR